MITPQFFVRTHKFCRTACQGFSLVELMVGIVIGMLGVVIMTQLVIQSEAQKRTTTDGADAQSNGMIALSTIERDIRAAGFGYLSPAVLGAGGCTQILGWLNGAVNNFSAAPVRIVDGGVAGATDRIEIQYGNSFESPVPVALTTTMAAPMAGVTLARTAGFQVNDLIMMAQGTNCVITQITAIDSVALTLQRTAGVGSFNPTVVNTPASWPSFTAVTPAANVFNLGQFTRRIYLINAQAELQYTDFNSLTPSSAASNIVNIQAQYGVALAGSQVVSCWVNAVDADAVNACHAPDNWSVNAAFTTPTSVNLARIKAIRIAVVARSSLPEKPSITGSGCDATTVVPVSWPGGPVISLTADANWQCYRYRVFQTVVPLRNVIWGNL